jgi:Spy/CpxP family protein refolding chaperone
VKIWKVILATIVIFAAGVFAGGVITKALTPESPAQKPPVPGILSQERFQKRLKQELKLTADQTNRIDKIFADNKERIKILWDLIGPEVQKERQAVRENIRAILTPEQREKFEQLLKEPPHPSDQQRHGPRPGTNGPKLLQANGDSRI